MQTYENYIFELFKNKKGVGNSLFFNPNKLRILKIASACGLKIPSTFISSFNEQLANVIKNSITKSISEKLSYSDGEHLYDMFTSLAKEEFLQKKEEEFFPSLIQEKITKQFEIRIFFLGTVFFTIAFFSQEKERTSIDTRRINFSDTIRIIPFKLPKYIKDKLCLFIKKVKMNTGSIDMIVTPEDQYVFLEVNPWGYFNLHIEIGNFPIDYLIAKKLKSFDNEYKSGKNKYITSNF